MKSISEIDANFRIETKIDKQDIKFYDIKRQPFKIYGVFYENGKYRRIPEAVAKAVSEDVWALHTNTAGGRVRFKTDSPYIAIHAEMSGVGKMSHFALSGSAGFDLYDADKGYIQTFIPPFDIADGYESVIETESSEIREYIINFPLYSNVDELYIGISDTASVYEPDPYRIEKPIVYYGSSITQGGCASRPGNSYEGIISHRLDCNYINLGFSGSAMAEEEIAEYIKKLDMSVFVYDYDHNAPSAEHLANTHEKMFNTIRKANPGLPVILMSRPKYYLTEDEKVRLDIIKNTYNNAVENGDRNVYLIEGPELMKTAGYEGTVDNCHPNDLGFGSMAAALGDLLEKIL
ncbi:MAG: SGNH/GDSL hydrolase family protein, partial [Firmicutes bacterium]|nr:SGNH/GDSL hydrolase family protein [Bacillota bacterium]